MAYFWADREPIAVRLNEMELPTHFDWRGKRHLVRHISNHWRVDQEWWRARIWRDYFTLLTNTGLLVIVYHDLDADTWHLHRLYD